MTKPATWHNRIVEYGTIDPREVDPNPLNPRAHPDRQRDAYRALMRDVGYIAPVILNVTTGHLIDGHMRVEEAIRDGVTELPVIRVELTEAQERTALASFDPIAAMAEFNRERTRALLDQTSTGEAPLMQLFSALAVKANVIPGVEPDDDDADDKPIPRETSDPPWAHTSSPALVRCPECGCEFDR